MSAGDCPVPERGQFEANQTQQLVDTVKAEFPGMDEGCIRDMIANGEIG